MNSFVNICAQRILEREHSQLLNLMFMYNCGCCSDPNRVLNKQCLLESHGF